MNIEARATRAEVDTLADQIAEASALIDSATHGLLAQIRRFDSLEGWGRQGALSCAHWLTWRVGLGLGAAREQVRVANALGALPAIDEALRRGEVSYSKVRAMTRVATPANERELLDIARSSTAAQLERICRLYRQVAATSAEQARASDDARWVRVRTTDDGMVRIEAQLAAEEAALVLRAIEVSATKGGRPDGLVAMADAALRGDAPERSPTEVVVHIDAATLDGHVDDGGGISAEASRRLCCDAGLVPVVEDARGATLDVGRRTRSVPAAIRRALSLRDCGCRFPGCERRHGVHAHHLHHWIDGGETSLANLASLCHRHHRYVHEYGFSVTRDDEGRLEFLDPDGRAIPATGARPPHSYDADRRMRELARARAVAITPMTSLPRWSGETPDYAFCVDVLLRADRSAISHHLDRANDGREVVAGASSP
jgi:hypothetical protein